MIGYLRKIRISIPQRKAMFFYSTLIEMIIRNIKLTLEFNKIMDPYFYQALYYTPHPSCLSVGVHNLIGTQTRRTYQKTLDSDTQLK